MQSMTKCALAVASVAFALGSSAASGQVFGDFEGADPGTWGYWSGGVQTPIGDHPTLELSTADASTGSTSVLATNTSNSQSLAYAADFATREAFTNATQFQFDVIVPPTANADSGYWQIYELILNSDAGWQDITAGITNTDGNGANIYWWGADSGPGSGDRRLVTFTVDYSTVAAAWGGVVPGYLELVFSLNNDGVHSTAYIDNFRIVVPEPASIGLVSIGALGLLRRRRA